MTTASLRRRTARAASIGVVALTLTAIVAGPASAVTTRHAGPATGIAPVTPVTPVAEALGTGACAPRWEASKSEPTVANGKAAALCEVDRRLETIRRLNAAVDGARRLTDAHQAALEAILERTATGLTALRAEIDADTALADLRADTRRIYEDFRVYALVARQVRLVIGADAVDGAVAKGEQIADRLEQAIATARAGGRDTTTADAKLVSLRAHLAAADAAVDGIADAVLPLTPAQFNAGTATPVLDDARAAIADARRVELKAAIADARAIIAALK